MKGTFVRCSECGKRKAWGNPVHWQKSFPHSKPDCKGKIEVVVQATGCKTRGQLGDQIALVEAWGREADYVMMDLEDYLALKSKNVFGNVRRFWEVKVILNDYITPNDEVEIK